MADVTAAPKPRAGTGRRERVRAEGERGTYRTFPARLPATLTALAGVFVMLGSLGAAVRASAVADTHEDPKQVRVLMGYRLTAGWVLFVLGLVLIVAALAWLRRGRVLKLGAFAVVVVTGSLVVQRLLAYDERAGAWADAARRSPRYLGFHAGFGWGAWTLLLGAVLAAFGVLVGVLREIDLQRGIEG